MPVNDAGKLTGPLSIFNGVTAYGTSAKGGTRAAYDAVCRDVFGGPMNMRRSFTGLPVLFDTPTLWSSKPWDEPAMQDAAVAFAAYGQPTLHTYHHEPTGKAGVPEFTDPGVWRDRNAAWADRLPANVASGAVFMGQDARDGKSKEFLPTKPPWLEWIGWDAYCLDVVNGKTPAQLFGACVAESERLGVPWGLAEFGLAGPADARLRWFDKAIQFWCDNKHCLFVINFQSNIGDRAPTNFDGTKEWAAQKASDRFTAELPEKWRSLAHLTRRQAAASGNVVGF